MNERHYNHGGYEFILEPLSDSLVRVTHRDQTGYLGIIMNWDAGKPYAVTRLEDAASEDGVDDMSGFATPEAALTALCNVLLHFQRIEDSKRINPEERKQAARKVLREFLDELPDLGGG